MATETEASDAGWVTDTSRIGATERVIAICIEMDGIHDQMNELQKRDHRLTEELAALYDTGLIDNEMICQAETEGEIHRHAQARLQYREAQRQVLEANSRCNSRDN